MQGLYKPHWMSCFDLAETQLGTQRWRMGTTEWEERNVDEFKRQLRRKIESLCDVVLRYSADDGSGCEDWTRLCAPQTYQTIDIRHVLFVDKHFKSTTVYRIKVRGRRDVHHPARSGRKGEMWACGAHVEIVSWALDGIAASAIQTPILLTLKKRARASRNFMRTVAYRNTCCAEAHHEWEDKCDGNVELWIHWVCSLRNI